MFDTSGKHKSSIYFRVDSRIKVVFVILLFQSIILNFNHFSFFPSVLFPSFQADEFKSEKDQPLKIDEQNKVTLKVLYPHDKRYYLFLQRACEYPETKDKANTFVLKNETAMKVFMQVYFLLYVLSGGFRHVVFEAQFFNFLNNEPSTIWLTGAMLLLQIVALAYVFWQRNEFLIAFYTLLFSTDLYVQNFIKFESSVILIHQLPLIAFLYLNEGKIRLSQDSLRYALLLMIAVGFVSSGLSKLTSGWLNTHELNLKSHILTLQNRYAVPVILKADLLYFMPNWMWKLLDLLIVFFQLSFLSFFFSLRFLNLRFFALICFHWAISLTMGIHVFYPYLFIYILIFAPWEMKKTPALLNWILKTIGIVFVLFICIDASDTDFVMKRLPFWFYVNYDLFLTFTFGIFLLIFMRRTQKAIYIENT